MLKITAPHIFDGKKLLQNVVLVLDNQGKCLSIEEKQNINSDGIRQFKTGILCPGFINAHCHLELSHLKNKIPKHTGLLHFILSVIKTRYFIDELSFNQAVQETITHFKNEGVVAIGDICNNVSTIKLKKKNALYFHNFIEAIGFDEHIDKKKIDNIIDVYNQFINNHLSSSIVPHAPYSVSAAMIPALGTYFQNQICSIHNQESDIENLFFQSKQGPFVNFYNSLNIPIDFFQASHKNSIQSVYPFLAQHKSLILVHNTFITEKDITYLQQQSKNIFYCVCIHSNLYIENKLPDIATWKRKKLNIIIGTDSWASNDNLSILYEMQKIQQHFAICLSELLQWTCYNGARALNLEQQFGSIELGKTPGIVWIDNVVVKDNMYFLTPHSHSMRII